MIKNEKQYQVTKARLNEFRESYSELQSNVENDPIYAKIEQDALRYQISQLEKELREYEMIKSGTVNEINIDSLSSFHEVLIKGRIAKGWTQAELAMRLEIKEQQIQRYELCNYSTASMARVNQVASILDLGNISIKARLNVKEHSFNIPEEFNKEDIQLAKQRLKNSKSLFSIS